MAPLSYSPFRRLNAFRLFEGWIVLGDHSSYEKDDSPFKKGCWKGESHLEGWVGVLKNTLAKLSTYNYQLKKYLLSTIKDAHDLKAKNLFN